MYKFNPLTGKFDLVTDISAKADLVDGKVPSEQLPSYIDDVIEVANFAALPLTGEQGKIYVTLDDNKNYRWSGSAYILLNPVDLSNYYNKTEVDNSLLSTQLNSSPVLLNTNTVVNEFVYSRNKVFVCSSGITIDIDPTLSTIGTEYTFINGDDSIITLNPTAGKGIGFYTSNYTLTNKGQSVTLVKRTDILWDIKNEFTNETKKIAIQFKFLQQALTSGSVTTAEKNTTVKDSGMLTANEKTNSCLSYDSGTKTFTVNKAGWYDFSGNMVVYCYFSAVGAYLKSALYIYRPEIGIGSVNYLGMKGHQISTAPENLGFDKLLPFSNKFYFTKNLTFRFQIELHTATLSANLSAASTVTIEYLGN